jgi:hypothetical protein
MNVYISTDHAGFTVPAQYAHLARRWEEVCRDAGPMIWIQHDPVFRGSRHYRVSHLRRARSGTFHRSSIRYATLDSAVRAAMRAASI